MAYAISCWFDSAFESKILEIWQSFHVAGISSIIHQGYRPHITLAVFEKLDIPAFTSHLGSTAADIACYDVVFPYIGIFTSDRLVAFLGITVNPEILDLHLKVHESAICNGQGPRQYYLPGRWNPHCTLAHDLTTDTLPKCLNVLQNVVLPIQARIDRLGIIDTPSEVELHTIPLMEKKIP